VSRSTAKNYAKYTFSLPRVLDTVTEPTLSTLEVKLDTAGLEDFTETWVSGVYVDGNPVSWRVGSSIHAIVDSLSAGSHTVELYWSPSTSPPTPTTKKLTVNVMDRLYKPLFGATVRVNKAGALIDFATTDETGTVSFNLPIANYGIEVSRPGYKTATEVVYLNTDTSVDIILEKVPVVPGFEAILAIAGLVAVAYLVLRGDETPFHMRWDYGNE